MALLDAVAISVDPDNGVRAEAATLNARFGDLDAAEVVALAAEQLFPGAIALVSSFGSESAVLLHRPAWDPTWPTCCTPDAPIANPALEPGGVKSIHDAAVPVQSEGRGTLPKYAVPTCLPLETESAEEMVAPSGCRSTNDSGVPLHSAAWCVTGTAPGTRT